ncbi:MULTISPECIES: GPW/gp25 family protein [Cyanophyceae]|uniref:GPW/gp25 family protein n=1 Tax=Leptolyngbya subtilissima DQ-A4 TaxID=2933933 RepID=A0ABV0JZR3_9CYAN|nr:GPW/gp25 family protein [Nodosilinea sp. FACHB-141]MBD2112582.1 GPW/gp25 family protein [Nodosilinea sp. FACHB-141]
MDSDFLGVGWTSPVTLDGKGQIQPARYEEAVRQSIRMILSTARGERLMRPDFGCSLHDLVFSTNSVAAIGQVISAVQESLIQWEPRIDVLNVTAIPDADEPNRLLIDIRYLVRTTNNLFNLVYPFYVT